MQIFLQKYFIANGVRYLRNMPVKGNLPMSVGESGEGMLPVLIYGSGEGKLLR